MPPKSASRGRARARGTRHSRSASTLGAATRAVEESGGAVVSAWPTVGPEAEKRRHEQTRTADELERRLDNLARMNHTSQTAALESSSAPQSPAQRRTPRRRRRLPAAGASGSTAAPQAPVGAQAAYLGPVTPERPASVRSGGVADRRPKQVDYAAMPTKPPFQTSLKFSKSSERAQQGGLKTQEMADVEALLPPRAAPEFSLGWYGAPAAAAPRKGPGAKSKAPTEPPPMAAMTMEEREASQHGFLWPAPSNRSVRRGMRYRDRMGDEERLLERVSKSSRSMFEAVASVAGHDVRRIAMGAKGKGTAPADDSSSESESEGKAEAGPEDEDPLSRSLLSGVRSLRRARKRRGPSQEQQHAAVRIQAPLRGFITRQRLIERGGFSVLFLARDARHRHYLHRCAAATTLQAWVRGCWDRRIAAARRRVAQARDSERRSGAVAVQRMWRGLAERRRYRRTQWVVVRLQALARGMRVRREAARRNEAAIEIQRVVRGYIARARTRHMRRVYWATALLQRVWRGHVARMRFHDLLEEKEAFVWSATLVQSVTRRLLARAERARRQVAGNALLRRCEGAVQLLHDECLRVLREGREEELRRALLRGDAAPAGAGKPGEEEEAEAAAVAADRERPLLRWLRGEGAEAGPSDPGWAIPTGVSAEVVADAATVLHGPAGDYAGAAVLYSLGLTLHPAYSPLRVGAALLLLACPADLALASLLATTKPWSAVGGDQLSSGDEGAPRGAAAGEEGEGAGEEGEEQEGGDTGSACTLTSVLARALEASRAPVDAGVASSFATATAAATAHLRTALAVDPDGRVYQRRYVPLLRLGARAACYSDVPRFDGVRNSGRGGDGAAVDSAEGRLLRQEVSADRSRKVLTEPKAALDLLSQRVPSTSLRRQRAFLAAALSVLVLEVRLSRCRGRVEALLVRALDDRVPQVAGGSAGRQMRLARSGNGGVGPDAGALTASPARWLHHPSLVACAYGWAMEVAHTADTKALAMAREGTQEEDSGESAGAVLRRWAWGVATQGDHVHWWLNSVLAAASAMAVLRGEPHTALMDETEMEEGAEPAAVGGGEAEGEQEGQQEAEDQVVSWFPRPDRGEPLTGDESAFVGPVVSRTPCLRTGVRLGGVSFYACVFHWRGVFRVECFRDRSDADTACEMRAPEAVAAEQQQQEKEEEKEKEEEETDNGAGAEEGPALDETMARVTAGSKPRELLRRAAVRAAGAYSSFHATPTYRGAPAPLHTVLVAPDEVADLLCGWSVAALLVPPRNEPRAIAQWLLRGTVLHREEAEWLRRAQARAQRQAMEREQWWRRVYFGDDALKRPRTATRRRPKSPSVHGPSRPAAAAADAKHLKLAARLESGEQQAIHLTPGGLLLVVRATVCENKDVHFHAYAPTLQRVPGDGSLRTRFGDRAQAVGGKGQDSDVAPAEDTPVIEPVKEEEEEKEGAATASRPHSNSAEALEAAAAPEPGSRPPIPPLALPPSAALAHLTGDADVVRASVSAEFELRVSAAEVRQLYGHRRDMLSYQRGGPGWRARAVPLVRHLVSGLDLVRQKRLEPAGLGHLTRDGGEAAATAAAEATIARDAKTAATDGEVPLGSATGDGTADQGPATALEYYLVLSHWREQAEEARRHEMATRLTAWVRGCLARARLVRARKWHATIEMQRVWRGHCGRERARAAREARRQRLAASRLCAFYRASLARSVFALRVATVFPEVTRGDAAAAAAVREAAHGATWALIGSASAAGDATGGGGATRYTPPLALAPLGVQWWRRAVAAFLPSRVLALRGAALREEAQAQPGPVGPALAAVVAARGEKGEAQRGQRVGWDLSLLAPRALERPNPVTSAVGGAIMHALWSCATARSSGGAPALPLSAARPVLGEAVSWLTHEALCAVAGSEAAAAAAGKEGEEGTEAEASALGRRLAESVPNFATAGATACAPWLAARGCAAAAYACVVAEAEEALVGVGGQLADGDGGSLEGEEAPEALDVWEAAQRQLPREGWLVLPLSPTRRVRRLLTHLPPGGDGARWRHKHSLSVALRAWEGARMEVARLADRGGDVGRAVCERFFAQGARSVPGQPLECALRAAAAALVLWHDARPLERVVERCAELRGVHVEAHGGVVSVLVLPPPVKGAEGGGEAAASLAAAVVDACAWPRWSALSRRSRALLIALWHTRLLLDWSATQLQRVWRAHRARHPLRWLALCRHQALFRARCAQSAPGDAVTLLSAAWAALASVLTGVAREGAFAPHWDLRHSRSAVEGVGALARAAVSLTETGGRVATYEHAGAEEGGEHASCPLPAPLAGVLRKLAARPGLRAALEQTLGSRLPRGADAVATGAAGERGGEAAASSPAALAAHASVSARETDGDAEPPQPAPWVGTAAALRQDAAATSWAAGVRSGWRATYRRAWRTPRLLPASVDADAEVAALAGAVGALAGRAGGDGGAGAAAAVRCEATMLRALLALLEHAAARCSAEGGGEGREGGLLRAALQRTPQTRGEGRAVMSKRWNAAQGDLRDARARRGEAAVASLNFAVLCVLLPAASKAAVHWRSEAARAATEAPGAADGADAAMVGAPGPGLLALRRRARRGPAAAEPGDGQKTSPLEQLRGAEECMGRAALLLASIHLWCGEDTVGATQWLAVAEAAAGSGDAAMLGLRAEVAAAKEERSSGHPRGPGAGDAGEGSQEVTLPSSSRVLRPADGAALGAGVEQPLWPAASRKMAARLLRVAEGIRHGSGRAVGRAGPPSPVGGRPGQGSRAGQDRSTDAAQPATPLDPSGPGQRMVQSMLDPGFDADVARLLRAYLPAACGAADWRVAAATGGVGPDEQTMGLQDLVWRIRELQPWV